MDNEQIIVPLETVTRIANWLRLNPTAKVMDVMAEFDLTYDEALYALTTAKLVILRLEMERLGNVFPQMINILAGRKPKVEACAFCGSTDDVATQDMGDGREMRLCQRCRQNIADGERAANQLKGDA